MAAAGGGGRPPLREYACGTAEETKEWMEAIAAFLSLHRPLLEAHVVNFFKDRLWELVDAGWMECLRKEPVETLKQLPSGLVQDYWPTSLVDFVNTLRSLVIPREAKLSHPILQKLHLAMLNNVIAQGMNEKKKHEVSILAAIVNTIAKDCGSETVIDVGSGQGYLAQVLSFEYQLYVIAIDASSHHSSVTKNRAERIRKYYAARCSVGQQLRVPLTVTCNVLSSETLETITSTASSILPIKACGTVEPSDVFLAQSKCNTKLVLAGLHACGDLSVNMLRTFVNCERVKALVSIGCCYNLLSEDDIDKMSVHSGFPMSTAGKMSSLKLGKNIRDLACESAERWKSRAKDMALDNFDVHSFRAAFQILLEKNFPEVLRSSPSIGRRGKALRRQKFQRHLESHIASHPEQCVHTEDLLCTEDLLVAGGAPAVPVEFDPYFKYDTRLTEKSDKFRLFKEFSNSGLGHLHCSLVSDPELLEVWREVAPFNEYIGPFWCLRAALGPLVETYILLDRLLYIQEQGNSLEAFLVPIFNPTISPRNMAIIALKTEADDLRGGKPVP